MITKSEDFEKVKFEIISKKSFKVNESLIFSIIFIIGGGVLFLWRISFYSLGISSTPSFASIGIILLGVSSLVRYIIQYQYMIQNKELSKSIEEYNKKTKSNNFSAPNYKCNGCNKNLNPILFKAPIDNLIKPFKFRGIGIKGHFCKYCVKSYFLIELAFFLLIVFLWEISAITIYFLYMWGFIISIILIFVMTLLPISFIIMILVEQIKILRKYK